MTKKSRITALVMLLVGLEAARRLVQTRRAAEEVARLAEEVHATDRLRSGAAASLVDEADFDIDLTRAFADDPTHDPAHAPGHRHLGSPAAERGAPGANERADAVWHPGPVR